MAHILVASDECSFTIPTGIITWLLPGAPGLYEEGGSFALVVAKVAPIILSSYAADTYVLLKAPHDEHLQAGIWTSSAVGQGKKIIVVMATNVGSVKGAIALPGIDLGCSHCPWSRLYPPTCDTEKFERARNTREIEMDPLSSKVYLFEGCNLG